MLADGSRASVVCGQSQDEALEGVTGFVGVFVEVSAQEFDGAVEVLFGVVAIADAETPSGAWHELPEALCTSVGAGVGVEIGLTYYEGHDEARIDSIVGGVGQNCFGNVLRFCGGEFAVALLDEFGVGSYELEKIGAESGGVFEGRRGGFGNIAGEARVG